MTYPKMKPCPRCGSDVSCYTYESGWSRVECDSCDGIFSCEGSKIDAIRAHNKEAALTDDFRDSGAPTTSREPAQTNATQPAGSQTSAQGTQK